MTLEIRAIRGEDEEEILWVAVRMRLTLMEVLGNEVGEALYSMDWLDRRVRYHLDPLKCLGQIFLCVLPDGRRLGYTIVRREEPTLGLFSTTYVDPEWRRRGVARLLVSQGELWMRGLGLAQSVTYTSETNRGLHALYQTFGYELIPGESGFVKLIKAL